MTNTDNNIEKLSPEEIVMMQPNQSLKDDLDDSTSVQVLEINSVLEVSPSQYSTEADSFLAEIQRNPSALDDDFDFDTVIFNEATKTAPASVSLFFISKNEYTNSQAQGELYDSLLEIESSIDNYDEKATWSIYPKPLPVRASDMELNIGSFPKVISQFIQLTSSDSSDIRYSSIGINEKTGFNGIVSDYVGGGQYDDFHYINGKLLINEDDSTEDEFFEEFSRIYGVDMVKNFNTASETSMKWNDTYSPETNLDLSLFDGKVFISNYPATPDPANTIFTDEVRGSILVSTLLRPSELSAPVTLNEFDDSLATIVSQVYMDYISSPEFSFDSFVSDVINPAFVYGSNQFLEMQKFIKDHRNSLELDDKESYDFQRFYAINDESNLVLLGLYENADEAVSDYKSDQALLFALNESEATGFADSATYFIGNGYGATLDSDGDLYPHDEVSAADTAIKFTTTDLMKSVNAFTSSIGEDEKYVFGTKGKAQRSKSRGAG